MLLSVNEKQTCDSAPVLNGMQLQRYENFARCQRRSQAFTECALFLFEKKFSNKKFVGHSTGITGISIYLK